MKKSKEQIIIKKSQFGKGVFAAYKTRGMTSHDVVARVRKITGVQRVGHGGTLDPLAEGVLVIAIGRENTKLLDQYVKGEKEYIAKIKLGEISVTDDSEGPIKAYREIKSRVEGIKKSKNKNLRDPITYDLRPKLADIERVIQKYIGIFPQVPPIYSAKKVNGKTAYKQARRGSNIKLEPKMVKIMDIKVYSFKYPFLTIRVTCGSGVYIRSLARDIGHDLGVGGYLASLERTRVATFKKNDCIGIEHLETSLKKIFSS